MLMVIFAFKNTLHLTDCIADMKKSIDAPLTKAGLTRKKRLFKFSVKERTEKKLNYSDLSIE